MKKIGLLIIMFILFLAACSKQEGFELISAKVDIVADNSKAGSLVISDKHKGTELIPTSIFYEFEIKNKGKTIDSTDSFQIKIEPSAELNEEIQKIVGQNIFSPTGLGGGWGLPLTPFKTNQIGTATIYFYLGTYEGNSIIPASLSSEQLLSIKNKALKSDLVLLVESKEVARFHLSEQK